MVRLVHFSDIHVFSPQAVWRKRDWFTKRLTGWFNLRFLPRGREFRDAISILRHLSDDLFAQQADLIIFSGDATALGTEEEFALAAETLRVGQPGTPPALAVPGNHDYYSHRSYRAGLFEKYFAPWLGGDRIDGQTYPFGRTVGPFYIVGVNSCKPNVLWFDSSGRVGADQLQRLRQLLAQPPAQRGARVIVTHYPITLASGRPERRLRRLHDLPALLAVAHEFGVKLWLHGHRHMPYYVAPTPTQPVPSLCVGSGTMQNLWTYAVYTFDGERLQVERRALEGPSGRFVTAGRTEVPLRLTPQPSGAEGMITLES
jgi:3',5'-cyclic AMP phosphodiesterase CpdA